MATQQRYTLFLPTELRARIDADMERTGVKRSTIVQRALKLYYESQDTEAA